MLTVSVSSSWYWISLLVIHWSPSSSYVFSIQCERWSFGCVDLGLDRYSALFDGLFSWMTEFWLDQLLPSHWPIPALFTQNECQELMLLLRSFGLQAVVYTQIVAWILLRVGQLDSPSFSHFFPFEIPTAHWWQQFFCLNRPLLTDVGNNNLDLPRCCWPFSPHAIFDVVISCLCPRILYFFFERYQGRFDPENGGLCTPDLMLVLSAFMCLIVSEFCFRYMLLLVLKIRGVFFDKAAIIFSATVMFLSLPGLDSLSCIMGPVAILCSSFSIMSTAISVFRFGVDLEQLVASVRMEGSMLPLVRSLSSFGPFFSLNECIPQCRDGFLLCCYLLYSLHMQSLGSSPVSCCILSMGHWLIPWYLCIHLMIIWGGRSWAFWGVAGVLSTTLFLQWW